MRLSPLRRTRSKDALAITGVVRLDRRTRNLARRLRPGDIAVIDHLDVDRASAEVLVGCRVAAVVNAAESVSGRYPNLGPEVIVAAGIPLLDAVGRDAFAALHEGDRVRLDGDRVYRGDTVVAQGRLLDADAVRALTSAARDGLAAQLEAFSLDTMEYLRRERDLLLDGVGVPDIRTPLDQRHVVLVARGYDYREDLRTLRPYLREHRPVLVGIDAGADALVEAGLTPDLVVGDTDTMSEQALRSGAEIVLHADRDGRASGRERLERLGVEAVVFPAAGTSEDVAMLLADSQGAGLIVTVGTHATLVEFLDRGRSGMASSFLTRLRVGPKLVDAKGVSRLYTRQIHTWQLMLLVLSGLVALLVALAATPAGEQWLDALRASWDDIVTFFGDLLP